MENPNGYFIVSDTDLTNLLIQVTKHIDDGCKVVNDITTTITSEKGMVYLQTMVQTEKPTETIVEKIKKLVELKDKIEQSDRAYHHNKRMFDELNYDRRSQYIEFDNFEILADIEKKMSDAKKDFDTMDKIYKTHSQALLDYLKKINCTSINGIPYNGRSFKITYHNGEFFIQPGH